MGIFDFLFESEENKAEKLRQEERTRQEQERTRQEQERTRQEQERTRQEQDSLVRVNWFKQQSRIESVSISRNTSIDFCFVPPGQFKMGDRQVDVKLSEGFWLARVPVTQKVWKSVTEESPSHFEGNPDLPVESVNWDDCSRFIGLLDKRLVLDGEKLRFDFPTEAQWEYACRAGSVGPYAVDKFWCAQEHPFPVGQLPGNALGIQDMHGNVWEWCRDVYQDRLPGGDDPCVLPPPLPGPPAIRPRDWTPPTPPAVYRVLRGGSWHGNAAYCTSAYRSYNRGPAYRVDYLGFRLALVPPSPNCETNL